MGIQNQVTQFTAEIPLAEVCRRNRKRSRSESHALESAFPVSEKEQLIFLYGSADVGPVEVSDAFRFISYAAAILIPLKSPKESILVQGKSGPMKLISSRFGRHSHGSATGDPLFGIEVIGRDIDLLNAFNRRNVYRVMRHRHQNIG